MFKCLQKIYLQILHTKDIRIQQGWSKLYSKNFIITDTRLIQTVFWSWLIIWLKQTQLVRTFAYSRPVFRSKHYTHFRSQHYTHAGYNRLTEITTMASMVT